MPRGQIHPKGESASGAEQFNGGNLSLGAVPISTELPWVVFVNCDVVPWALSLTTQARQTVGPYTMNPGMIQSWPAASFNQASAPLPTGGTASLFQYFYSAVALYGPPIGTSNGRSYPVFAAVPITEPSAVVYTVPLGYVFYLLTAIVTSTKDDPSSSMLVLRQAGSGANDYIFQNSTEENTYVGQGPANNVQIPVGLAMPEGDELAVNLGASPGEGSQIIFYGLLEPL